MRISRRQALQEAAGGLGAVALSWLLDQQNVFGASTLGTPGPLYNLKPKQPHFAPKAKNVIFIYISGGPSTIDMFDPKPGLLKYDGSRRRSKSKGVL